MQSEPGAVTFSQGSTIPAKTLSKEYFTYYIIIRSLLGSIISPACGRSACRASPAPSRGRPARTMLKVRT
eukprot:6852236-Prymnesium_polylepis.1